MDKLIVFLKKPWLYVTVLLIGLTFKFYNIGHRQFWYDEIYTIWHTSGHHYTYFDELTPKNTPVNIQYYRELMSNNKQGYNFWEQQKRIYSQLNLNPLHYSFLSAWNRMVGDKPVHYRYFNIFVFIMILPLFYLLTFKILKSKMAGLVAVSLLAVSPFFHYFVHEARYNIIFALLIILSHLCYLEFIGAKKIAWAIAYTVTSILALYASFLMVFILIGHFVYYTLILRKKEWGYYIASTTIGTGYLPWLFFIYNQRSELNTGLSWHYLMGKFVNFAELVVAHLTGIANSFVTIGTTGEIRQFIKNENLNGMGMQLVFSILIIALLVWAVYTAYRELDRKKFWFLASIIMPLMLFFLISDAIRGTGTSLVFRYSMPTYLTLIFFLAFFISHQSGKHAIRSVVIYFSLVGLCIFSMNRISNDPCWAIPYYCDGRKNLAGFISERPKALVVSNEENPELYWGNFMAFLNECTSNNIDILYATPDVDNLTETMNAKGYSDIFVVYPSKSLVENLKTRFGDKLKDITLEVGNIPPTFQIEK